MHKFFVLFFSVFLFVVAGCFSSEENPEVSIETPKPIIPMKMEYGSSPVKIVFTGDVMLGRYMERTMTKRGYDTLLSEDIKNLLSDSTAVIINHEGVLSGVKSEDPTPEMTRFSFPDSSAQFLKNIGVTHATLGNNHTQDYGKKGEERTYAVLKENSIAPFGRAFNDGNLTETLEIEGVSIALISYNDVFLGGYETLLEEIKNQREKHDVLIVLPHWGTEYFTEIDADIQKKAHEIINAGADIIIGTHPHVVAPIEQYKDGIIFYSLGNFIFDQIFSEDVRTGMLLQMEISPSYTNFLLLPTSISKNFYIDFLSDEERKKFLKKLKEKSKMFIETYGEIEFGMVHWKSFKK